MKKLLFLFLSTIVALNAQTFYYNNNQKVQLTPLPKSLIQSRSAVEGVEMEYYMTPNKSLVGVSDEILIKSDDIEYVLKSYSVELLTKISDTIYLLRVKDRAQTLELANKLYEDTKVELAHPNFSKEIQKR